ncbi:hypothetical protein TREES_T100006274 [Tupaia chinensis]|uniref:Uncharacterized protein n=1 Tax=Tupaia chinensis TaxID=246437 RepID=L9L9E2_TUPCH|nr:hypothetical protein TREES_T100006274 [Tupaia chinensis]
MSPASALELQQDSEAGGGGGGTAESSRGAGKRDHVDLSSLELERNGAQTIFKIERSPPGILWNTGVDE